MKNLVKQLVYMLLFSCTILSCSKEDQLSEVSPISSTSNGEYPDPDPCTTCEYEDLYKTVGNDNQVVGTVAICQTTTNLTITYTVSGNREKAWFQQTGLGIYGIAPTALNPSPNYLLEKDSHHGDKLRSFTYIIPLSDLGDYGDPGDIIYIAAYAVVPGQDGAGGMIWAGDLVPPTGNPNPRYFKYTIKECDTPEPPKYGCLFTQGYWFAKPDGSQWPVSNIKFGGQYYTYSEARAIFFSSNARTGKTAAKQAFLQGLALQLSLEGGAEACSYAVTSALRDINKYFYALGFEITKDNINTTEVNKTSSGGVSLARLKEAAGIISACLNTHACNEVKPDDLCKY